MKPNFLGAVFGHTKSETNLSWFARDFSDFNTEISIFWEHPQPRENQDIWSP